MLVDANVLLYAVDRVSPFHHMAARWLTEQLNGPSRIGLPWQSITAFLRIATHPRASAHPLGPAQAWRQVEEWLAAPASWVPVPTDRHAEVLGRLVRDQHCTGALIPDAHLAALALEHGVPLVSADTDFARFAPELTWLNPLAR